MKVGAAPRCGTARFTVLPDPWLRGQSGPKPGSARPNVSRESGPSSGSGRWPVPSASVGEGQRGTQGRQTTAHVPGSSSSSSESIRHKERPSSVFRSSKSEPIPAWKQCADWRTSARPASTRQNPVAVAASWVCPSTVMRTMVETLSSISMECVLSTAGPARSGDGGAGSSAGGEAGAGEAGGGETGGGVFVSPAQDDNRSSRTEVCMGASVQA